MRGVGQDDLPDFFSAVFAEDVDELLVEFVVNRHPVHPVNRDVIVVLLDEVEAIEFRAFDVLIDGKRDVVDRLDNVGLRECDPNRGDESEDQDHR